MKLKGQWTSLSASTLALLFGLCVSNAEPAVIISTNSPLDIAGSAGSYAPTFSADGRFVVFLSHASNLVTNDSLSPYLDVFLHDLTTSNTVLVSVSSTGVGGASADTAYPSISSNGQFVAFASAAGNLVAGDTNGAGDVFVRDLGAGTTSLISTGLNGGSAISATNRTTRLLSGNPVISASGRHVVYESFATNLAALPDKNAGNDLFIHDRQAGTTQLISVNATGDGSANAPSELPAVTPDARRVAFVSYSTDLVVGVTNQQGDIYVRDLEAGATTWASTNVAQVFADLGLNTYRCHAPVLSTNGQVVVFKASSPGSATGLVFRVELTDGLTAVISSNSPTATFPSISDDGRFLAYDEGTHVFLWDQLAGTNQLISARYDGTGSGNGPSRSPVLSANGQTVVFTSAATDLASEGEPTANGWHQVFVRDLMTGTTRFLTIGTNRTTADVNHLLANTAVSPDGSLVAFDSRSEKLAYQDLNRQADVFLADSLASDMRLISRRADERPSVTGARQVRIAPECLSADGRFLLFAGLLNNLPPDDTICCENLFVRDLATGVEEPITDFDNERPKEQVISANGKAVAYVVQTLANSPMESVVFYDRQAGSRGVASIDPVSGSYLAGTFSSIVLSPDGTKLAFLFTSTFSSLIRSLYLFDSTSGSNRLVSHRYNNSNSPVDGLSSTPRFSPDGHYLVFGNDHGGVDLVGTFKRGLYVSDLNANTPIRVIQVTNVGYPAVLSGQATSFSADSRFVVASYPGRWVVLHDLVESTNLAITSNYFGGSPSLNADGSEVAFQEWGFEPTRNVVVKNLKTSMTKLASVSTNLVDGGNSISQNPLLTRDGRYVVYSSRANNLSPLDTNQLSDIYARDLVRGVTILLSVNQEGTKSGNGGSTMPVLSSDGRTVVFQSFADDLAGGDYNFSRDIFIARLSDVSTDGDTLDDDWEMAYFDTLERDGSGDLDGDGSTDREEFVAGTDPTNLNSILRVITVTSLQTGQRNILWSATPGRTYRVQFKDSVEAAQWTTLSGDVTATGTTGTKSDTSVSSEPKRFYRVAVIQ